MNASPIIWSATPTPFRADGTLDSAALGRLQTIEWADKFRAGGPALFQ